MMKMDFQSKKTRGSVLRSASGAETLSRFSKGHKTTSGKSKQEENYEEMEIEELDVFIERALREIDVNLDLKRRILKHKMLTKKIKHKKL